MALEICQQRGFSEMDIGNVITEVEDIMCDQCILSAELNVLEFEKHSYPTRIRIAIDLLAQTVFPTFISIYSAYIRNQQSVLHSFRRQLFPAVVAFLANSVSRSLGSVQRIRFPLTLKVIRLQQPQAITSEETSDTTPEKSVECQVLYQPDDEILADVIFIHGLHGGLYKTWRQGEWRHDGHKLQHQTPVRRASTGDLHVPPRDKSLKRTISEMYSRIPAKIARKESEPREEQYDTDWDGFDPTDENYSHCWPQDWLPKDFPGARIIALNYTTDVLWCPVWLRKRIRTGMVARSQEMIEELLRIGVGKKPIVWVGHSKGGLFIKQILINAWEMNQIQPRTMDIFNQSKAIMFYSVPHRGSSLADVTLPLLRRSVELTEIQRNCKFVLDLHKRFLEIYKNNSFTPEIFSFIETSFTLMSFVYLKIVAYDSADPGIGIKCAVPLDHREICKPAGRDCFLYLELGKLIHYSIQKSNT